MNTCPVCYESFNVMQVTPCNHTFCRNCLRNWTTEHSSCPMCRQYVNVGMLRTVVHHPPPRVIEKGTTVPFSSEDKTRLRDIYNCGVIEAQENDMLLNHKYMVTTACSGNIIYYGDLVYLSDTEIKLQNVSVYDRLSDIHYEASPPSRVLNRVVPKYILAVV